MKQKLTCWFVRSTIPLLLCTAIAKLISSTGSAQILQFPDPILMLPFQWVFWIVGGIELLVVSICIFAKQPAFKLASLAWLATMFLAYRFGLWWIDWHRPCKCLGNLTDALHISPQIAGTAMKCILVYLLIGSYVGLFFTWKEKREAIIAPTSSKEAPQAQL